MATIIGSGNHHVRDHPGPLADSASERPFEKMLKDCTMQTGDQMSFRVFISYSTEDLPAVNEVMEVLENQGAEVFIAEYAVKPSQRLDPEIENAIRRTDLLVLLWSKRSTKSAYVGAEIGYGKSLNKAILPILLDEGLDAPPFLKDLKYLKAWTGRPQAISWIGSFVEELVDKKHLTNSLLLAGALLFLVWALIKD